MKDFVTMALFSTVNKLIEIFLEKANKEKLLDVVKKVDINECPMTKKVNDSYLDLQIV